MLLDLLAFGLFLGLLARLRAAFLSRKVFAEGEGGKITKDPNGRISRQATDPVTVGVFLALLVSLLLPEFAPQGVDAEIEVVDALSDTQLKNWVVRSASGEIQSDSLLLFDLDKSPKGFWELTNEVEAVLAKVLPYFDWERRRLLIGTYSYSELYFNERHAAVELVVRRRKANIENLDTVHAVSDGEGTSLQDLVHMAEACLDYDIKTVVMASCGLSEHARQTRRALINLANALLSNDTERTGALEEANVDSWKSSVVIEELKLKQEPTMENESSPGMGWNFLSMIGIFATRIVGFLFPFHQTRKELMIRNKKRETSIIPSWISYWIFFSFLSLIEDALFRHLVLILPLYLLGKLLFIGFCISPPSNARKVYIQLMGPIHRIREERN